MIATNPEFKTQSLSNRQFSFLGEGVEKGGISLDRMLEVSQTTAGSAVRRGLYRWNHELGVFEVTPLGHDVFNHFVSCDIGRAGTYRPFSKFIENRELDSLTKDRRAKLKDAYDEAKRNERKGEVRRDRPREARVRLRTVPPAKKTRRAAA